MNEGWIYATVILGEALLHFVCDTERLMGHRLHPLAAYTLGVLAMMVPFTFWLIGLGDCSLTVIAWTLWKTILCAGVSVLASYGVDAVIDLLWKSRHVSEENALLSQQVKDAKADQA